MNESQTNSKILTVDPKSQKRRPTIGLLSIKPTATWSLLQWQGMVDACREREVNLIFFPGGGLRLSAEGYKGPDNYLYDLVSAEILDGLVIWASTVGAHCADQQELEGFCQRFQPLPIVSLERQLANAPTIVKDDYQSMRQIITHLIKAHGYRRLAFLLGTPSDPVHQARYRAYTETLADYDLPFEPNLVFQTDMLPALDERHLRPGLDFEAVVASDDDKALATLQMLQARGIRVPEEVAITGHDDQAVGTVVTPPLTTIHPRYYEMGQKSAEMILALIAGEQIPAQVILPTELVIRRSCGCAPAAVIQTVTEPTQAGQQPLEDALAANQENILAGIAQAVGGGDAALTWARRLLDSFTAEVQAEAADVFWRELEEILHQVVMNGGEVLAWQGALSVLWRLARPYLDGEALFRAEDLCLQGQAMIGEIAQRARGYQAWQVEQQTQLLNMIGATLITTFDIKGLMDTLAQELPRLGIPSGYLSIYENPQQPAAASRLLLAYHAQGRIELDVTGQVFPSSHLIPAGFWLPDRPYSFIVEPLYFREAQLGFVLFEVGPREGQIYTTLREQISSALKGALLVEQEEKRVRQLQTVAEVSTATSTILDTALLLQQVVDLTKERFGLYHAHVYLLNETGDVLHLAAGAGEAGRQMVADGWSISLKQEQSLVARAARTGKVVIVDNVRKAADWLPNPLLPHTYAEMAVPIMLEGKVVGVLDVQADRIGGLDEKEADLLRLLANHIAVALTNARLFEETTQSKEEAEQARKEAEQARKEIELANQALEMKIWQTTGQAQLNDKMQGEQDVATLANNIIRQLCQYLEAPIGVLYVAENNYLKLVGSYAYSRNNSNTQFKFGEGLVGQVALEKQPMLIANVPDEHLAIRSGLVETPPKFVMIYPFVYENRVVGVIELGTLTQFSQAQTEFLQTALDSIAIAFNTAQARARINELLAETQQQAEELQTQSEELRVANEELEAQTESLRLSEAQLKEKQTILDQQNQELKEAQEELQRKAQELALASKYKSEFLANMSHELRTPLNSLLILARMLADNKEGNLNPEQVESAQIMYSGGTDLLNLINDILDLSKVEAGQMSFSFEQMPLTDLVSAMQVQFNHLAQEKGLAFNLTVAEDVPLTLTTDSQRVQQIIKNLLSNAFKFTDQGSVSLNIYRPDSHVDLSRSSLDPSQAIALSVADTGIGMTAEQLKVIFEAFQQADGGTSRQYGGTGLGLSISRELAAKLGGQIEVESEPGRGSTFTLYLPIAGQGIRDTAKAQISPTSRPSKPAASQPPPVIPSTPSPKLARVADDRTDLNAPAQPGEEIKVVLIIEDDPKFAKVAYNYAHKKGFKCLIANQGQAGLDLVKTYQPQAIILDLNLPDISGWEVLARLKNDPATRHIPVHIMSVEDEVLDAYRRGAMGYLTKPVSQEGLEQAFEKIQGLISRQIKTLLLVEDDAHSRRSIKKLLNGNDVRISEAEQGKIALELLRVQPFDCMILDLSLPDMNGFEVLNTINRDETIVRCPVIVYTGRELTPQENEELMQYADSVIVKGVKSPERLLDETALFLHRVVADMPSDKQQTIKQLYHQDDLLKDKKVLIVDDDMRNSFALSKLLSDKGIIVKIAQNGQKALELLAEEPKIDLVLMDIMMPVLDGYETIKRIRAQPQFKTLPILALTAKAMTGDREKCLEVGANDYLPKPVDIDRLFSMLRVWLYQ
ncbi:MAG: response regulator [Anaerolineae bacterium]|nr:response regulator [Anaerolineae bacterium]